MHTHVRMVDCTLSPGDARVLEHRLARLERVLPRLDPDLLHLRLLIQRHPRRLEFRCSLTFTMKNRVFPATRQHAGAIRTLITDAFDRLEAQIERAREARVQRRTRSAASRAGAATTG